MFVARRLGRVCFGGRAVVFFGGRAVVFWVVGVAMKWHGLMSAVRDGQQTEMVSALHTRGRVLRLFVLLEVLYVTSRPPSCCNLAPRAVWIPGSGNGIFCPGYVRGQACSCGWSTVKKQILGTSLSPNG